MDGAVIDAAAQFAASQESGDTTDSTETTSQQVEGSTNDGEGGDTSEQTQKVSVSDKSAKEIARMARALQNLQAENSNLKTENEGLRAKGTKQTETKVATGDNEQSNHPALKGLQVDPDDGTVLYHGAWVTPEFVMAQHAQQQKIDQLAALLEGKQAEEEAAKQQAKIERVQGQLEQAVNATIAEMRSAAFPGVQGQDAASVDDYISSNADNLIAARVSQLVEDGEFSPENLQKAVQESIEEAFEKAQKLFGIFGQRQFDKNKQYADTHKVKSGGQTAVPAPSDFRKMTISERGKTIDEIARRAASG